MADENRNREGFSFYQSSNGTSTLTRYTDISIGQDDRVRLLHQGKLDATQCDQIRSNVIAARDCVNNAVSRLSEGYDRLDEAKGLVHKHFKIPLDKIDSAVMKKINDRLRTIADGLHTTKLEIKLVDGLAKDDSSNGKIKRAPHRNLDGRAAVGRYTDRSPDVAIKLTKAAACDTELGAETVINLVAINAAQLENRGFGESKTQSLVKDRRGTLLNPSHPSRLDDAAIYAAFSKDLSAPTTERGAAAEEHAVAQKTSSRSRPPSGAFEDIDPLPEKDTPPPYVAKKKPDSVTHEDKITAASDSEEVKELVKALTESHEIARELNEEDFKQDVKDTFNKITEFRGQATKGEVSDGGHAKDADQVREQLEHLPDFAANNSKDDYKAVVEALLKNETRPRGRGTVGR